MTPGSLVFSRVLEDPGACLERALDESFTGVATLEPRAALVRNAAPACYVAFTDGTPTRVAAPDADAAGEDALRVLADAAPCRVELRADATRDFPPDAAVDPAALAETLDRRELAPRFDAQPVDSDGDVDDHSPVDEVDALDAFLSDAERVTELRERAREEAESRADEWGFDLEDG